MYREKIIVNRQKLMVLVSFIAIIGINFIIMNSWMSNGNNDKEIIIRISRIATIEVIASIVCLKKIIKELLSPFGLFYIIAIIYTIGQIFGWTFGIQLGEKDLLTYGIDLEYVAKGLIYSLNGILALFCGSVVGAKTITLKEKQTEKNLEDISMIAKASKLLFLISLPFLVIYWIKLLPSIVKGGYLELYSTMENFSKLELLSSMIAELFPISLIMMYIANLNKKNVLSKFSLIVLFLYIIVILYIGGRSVAVELLLALFLANQYFGKALNKKKILVVAVLAYILLSILNGIADTRSNGNRTISDMLEGMSLGFTDTIGNFLGEMGWQLSSTSWTMQFMDHGYATPKYGLSYLTGFLVIIPNLGQWEVHPDELVNAGTWMQKLLNRKTGMGYSFIAESYYNFSWFGLLFLFVIGVCISKWLTAITVKNAKYNYKYMIIILMVFSTMLRPFIRSTFSASLRKLVYIVIASIFVMYMIKIFYKRYQNNNRGYHN